MHLHMTGFINLPATLNRQDKQITACVTG